MNSPGIKALLSKRKELLAIPIAAILVGTLILTGASPQQDSKNGPFVGGEVHGYVVVRFQEAKGTPEIFLPGARVFLKNRSDHEVLTDSVVSTNQSGRFKIPSQAPGAYDLCVEAPEYQSVCADEAVEISDHTVLLKPHLALTPLGGMIRGRVTLKDGTPAARTGASLHTSSGAAEVSLYDAHGHTLAGPVRTNGEGYYVLPGAITGSGLRLGAIYEAGTGSRPLSLVQADLSGSAPINVTVNNTPPRILSITAKMNGQTVKQVPPGSTVDVIVRAVDPENDELHYSWAAGSSEFISQDAPTVRWTLPDTSATDLLFVEVRDGKGGVDRASIALTTGDTVVLQTSPNRPASAAARVVPNAIPAHQGAFIDPALFIPVCQKTNVTDPTPTACDAETVAYYKTIGVFDAAGNPTSTLGTFSAWKKTFGFAQNPTQADPNNETRAVYYNNGDLRFGRDMHCRQIPLLVHRGRSEGSLSACYVSNFSDATGKPGGDPQTAIANAEKETNLIATVAMVGTHPDGTPSVNFFVYDAKGNPLKAAILDSEGPKNVPGVCIACHSGQYNTSTHNFPASLLPNFLPFDAPSFIQDTNPATSSIFGDAAQREAFRKLNGIIGSGVVGSSRVDLQACKLEYSIVSPK